MTLASQHTIYHHQLDLTLLQVKEESCLLAEVKEALQLVIMPTLETAFDKICPAEVVVSFDKIELDLGIIDQETLTDDLKHLYINLLYQELKTRYNDFIIERGQHADTGNTGTRQTITDTVFTRMSMNEKIRMDYGHFLETGRLPDILPYKYTSQNYDQAIVEQFKTYSVFRTWLYTLLRYNSTAALRFTFQAPPTLWSALFDFFWSDLSESQRSVWIGLSQLFQRSDKISLSSPVDLISNCPPIFALDLLLNPQKLNSANGIESWLTGLARYIGPGNKICDHLEYLMFNQHPALQKPEPGFWKTLWTQLKSRNEGNPATDIFTTEHQQISLISDIQEKRLNKQWQNENNHKQGHEPQREDLFKVPFILQPWDAHYTATPEIQNKTFSDSPNKNSSREKNIEEPRSEKKDIDRSGGKNKEEDTLIEFQIKSSLIPEDVREQYININNNEQPQEYLFYSGQAGLVILSPMLPNLFRHLDLLSDSKFRDIDTAVRAVHILYYLATGEEYPLETTLVLQKILCGLPVDWPIPRFIQLSQTEKKEADSLLKAVIAHWVALRNSSPDALRESFLRRNGRLKADTAGWQLVVENKGVDILMDKLPWSIAYILLPWMAKPISVDWN